MVDLTLYPNIYKYGINKDIVWYETYWGTKNSWFVNDVTVSFNHKNSYLQIDNSSIDITWDIKSDLLFEIINTLINNDNYDISDKDILIKPVKYVFNDIIYDFNSHNIYNIIYADGYKSNKLKLIFLNDVSLLWNSYYVPIHEASFNYDIQAITKYLKSDTFYRK